MPRAHAVALLSGGLDSQLAILLLRRQEIKVTAVTFLMHFGCDMSDKASCTTDVTASAHRYGYEVKMCHLADKFTAMVKNPKFGYGKNMNPCIDCRILMLREAAELRRMVGADFLCTGEVLGQRPMSQRRDTFNVIDREAGLKGKVLRPLCAKLMPPTEAELQGLVDRERLCDFSGRGRKPQMALAAEFGLTDYPAPAGGCLLTEPNYAFRLKELLAHTPDPTTKQLLLLRAGRHFRLPGAGGRLVVGRDEQDNARIEGLRTPEDYAMQVPEVGSPFCMIEGGATEGDIRLSAAICARYSASKKLPEVGVEVNRLGETYIIKVAPARGDEMEQYRINMPE